MNKTLDSLTKAETDNWTEEQWFQWYSDNKEEGTFTERKLKIRETTSDSPAAAHLRNLATNFFGETSEALVGYYNGKPAAYLEFEPLHNSGAYHIRAVSVEPEHRGKGLATEMIQELIKIANYITANIHTGNEASIKLFTSLGFQAQNTKNGYTEFFLEII